MNVSEDSFRQWLVNRTTRRQAEVVRLYCEEFLTDRQIAKRLVISKKTVETHLKNAAESLPWVGKRSALRRVYPHLKEEHVRSVNESLAATVKGFAAQHPENVIDVIGEVFVLYQSPGLHGLSPENVPDFVVHDEQWPMPRQLQELACTPLPGVEYGVDGAKWALSAFDEPVSDIRDDLILHVRPFRYFWARRTNDRLDEAKVGERTLRQRLWRRALPLHDSPLGNILVVHVVLTIRDKNGDEFVLFSRRRDNPEVVSYEGGSWSASFEEQCRGDPALCPGTAPKPADRSAVETALRGLDEEVGITGVQGIYVLSLVLEWANGYTGVVIRLHVDLESHPDLGELIDVENAWKLKHKDREADAVRLVPFTAETLVPIVFAGRDQEHWLPPPPGKTNAQLHRTTPVRIAHTLMQAGKLGFEQLRGL